MKDAGPDALRGGGPDVAHHLLERLSDLVGLAQPFGIARPVADQRLVGHVVDRLVSFLPTFR